MTKYIFWWEPLITVSFENVELGMSRSKKNNFDPIRFDLNSSKKRQSDPIKLTILYRSLI